MVALTDTLPASFERRQWIPPVPGEIWHQRYRIGETLGSGGMSVVVQATDLTLHRDVAIKCLQDSLADDESLQRFIAEARTTARMNSEHAVRIHDIGRSPSGAPFLSLELLEGTDLASVLEERGSLCVEDAILFVFQACEALAEAHALGIVHRDLKPSNLFMTRRIDGSACIKVIDFGIAEQIAQTRRRLPALVVGSPLYMAPEQLLSPEQIGFQVDIWALGLVLYELITGRLPFDEDGPYDGLGKRGRMAPLSELRSDLPRELDEVIGRCLQTEPGARYADIPEFVRALGEAVSEPHAAYIHKISSIDRAVRSSRPARADAVVPEEASAPPSGSERTERQGAHDAVTAPAGRMPNTSAR